MRPEPAGRGSSPSGEFADNDETVEGRYQHRNVDRARQRARPDGDGDDVPKIHERSVWLGRVVFDDELVARTVQLAAETRAVAAAGPIPPPLVDSPKCPRCSLAGICLPDELRYLTVGEGAAAPPRPLVPARDDALPLHVQHPGARIRKDGEVLQIVDDDKMIGEARLAETSQVVLFGAVHVTTPVVQELCQRGIPVCYLSSGGWFYGITHGMSHKNVELRRRRYAVAGDPARCLALARGFVRAKIANCRTLLRRNHPSPAEDLLSALKGDIRRVGQADRLDALLDVEGTAAHRHFSAFAEMLHPDERETATFDLKSRNRRPPRDPVNALLSLAYAMLTREWTVVLFSVGFDPYLGFYHQPRYGRPALALDLMEEYRPLIGDSLRSRLSAGRSRCGIAARLSCEIETSCRRAPGERSCATTSR